MRNPVHSFDVSLKEARHIQNELRKRVVFSNSISHIDEIELVGGADVAFIETNPDSSQADSTDNRFPDKDTYPVTTSHDRAVVKIGLKAVAGVVIIDKKHGCVVETACAAVPVSLPYIPGFLSFREGPALLAALGELSNLPGVMIYDGCGIAHPRGIGLASHMAVLTGIPSIGCAKSLLCGTCDKPGKTKGEWSQIIYHEKLVGACLRTRTNVKPVYVSPGSGFSITSARDFILSLTGKYRLPEPTRLAHNLVTAQKKCIIQTADALKL